MSKIVAIFTPEHPSAVGNLWGESPFSVFGAHNLPQHSIPHNLWGQTSFATSQPIASNTANLPQHTIPHNLWEEIPFSPHGAWHLSQQPIPQPEAHNRCAETQNLWGDTLFDTQAVLG